MAGLSDSVEINTQAAGRNRLELLLFRLAPDQCFGIDVFKVREVIQCPPLTPDPQSHPAVLGTASNRDDKITVMGLAHLIGGAPHEEPQTKLVIVTEYNHSVQGFLVDSVDHIVSLDPEETVPPAEDDVQGNYLSAVARIAQEPVRIIDIERLLQALV